jgi:hypothetical protein
VFLGRDGLPIRNAQSDLVIPPKRRRRIFAAQIAINARVIDVKRSRDIARVLVMFVSHTRAVFRATVIA